MACRLPATAAINQHPMSAWISTGDLVYRLDDVFLDDV